MRKLISKQVGSNFDFKSHIFIHRVGWLRQADEAGQGHIMNCHYWDWGCLGKVFNNHLTTIIVDNNYQLNLIVMTFRVPINMIKTWNPKLCATQIWFMTYYLIVNSTIYCYIICIVIVLWIHILMAQKNLSCNAMSHNASLD